MADLFIGVHTYQWWEVRKSWAAWKLGWPRVGSIRETGHAIRSRVRRGDKIIGLRIQGHATALGQLIGADLLQVLTAESFALVLEQVVGQEYFGRFLRIELGGCKAGRYNGFLMTVADAVKRHLGVETIVEGGREDQYFLSPGWEGETQICSATKCVIVRH